MATTVLHLLKENAFVAGETFGDGRALWGTYRMPLPNVFCTWHRRFPSILIVLML